MKHLAGLVVGLTWLIYTLPGLAEPSSLADLKAQTLERYAEDEPGILVSVTQGETTILRFTRGLADLGTRRALTPASQMRIASLTKQFVAVAIMQLVEQGRLSLDDPLSKHMPELGALTKGVTLRHLLNHTSGFPHHSLLFMNGELVPYDEHARGGFLFVPEGSRDWDFMPTNEDVIRILAQHPEHRFAPGTDWEYNNAAYIVLVQIIEKLTGTPFREHIAEHIFKPLGMSDSGVFDETRPRLASPTSSYVRNQNIFTERDESPFNLLHGDGGIYSTLEDLVAWRKAWQPGALVSAASLEIMTQPARLDDGTRITRTPVGKGYGMGWFIDDIGGEPIVFHGGGWAAFRHAIYHAPGPDIWVVVLTNRSDSQPYELGRALLAAALAG